MESDSHLSAEDVAALTDGQLPANRLPLVEAHLAVCAECRAEVASVVALAESAPRRTAHPSKAQATRVSQWWTRGAIAAAAAVLLFAVLPTKRSPNPGQATTEQRGAGATTITTVSPSPGERSPLGALHFDWRRDDGSTYRFFLSDSAGAQLYSTSTADTTVTLPAKIRLAPGSRYFWYVDALRPDGSSISSTPSSFTIRVP